MQKKLRLCLGQMTSSSIPADNIEALEQMVEGAVAQNADLLALPEASGLMNQNATQAKSYIVSAQKDPFILRCQALAKQYNLWLHTGSTPVKSTGERFLNHSNLIDNTGAIRSSYNKIHLFDVALAGQPAIGESQRYQGGDTAVLVDTPWGGWGQTICYDLRFPQLFRCYAQEGATIIFVPSAFHCTTGEAHWHTLLQARAIENGVWIVAAAQVGEHRDGRRSWGHSLVVSPWGDVVCDLGGEKAGLAVVDLDMEQVAQVRSQIPSLQNERAFQLVKS